MIVDEVEIGSNRIEPERLPRPMVSTLDTWDQSTQIDYPFLATHGGRRPGWNIPSIAVTSEPINTIRSSSNTRFVSPRIANRAAITQDATTSSTGYKPVPNMAQAIRTDSAAQVQFSLTARSTGTAAPFFAIYRDGVKISQEYRQSGAGASIDFLVSGSYVDPDPPMGFHTYDLRWHVDPVQGGTITAGGKQRTFQVSNLRAQ